MISYIGGKNRMADWISSFVPEDIETYVEPFGGAFWVYINSGISQRPQLKTVVYNDFNPYMVNLFRCASNPKVFDTFITKKNPPCQLKTDDPAEASDLSIRCSDFFYQCKENLFANETAIEYLQYLLKDKKAIIKKDRKNMNQVLKMARELKEQENNGLRDKFQQKIAAGRKDQNVALQYAYIVTCSFSGIDPIDAEFQDYKGKYNSKFLAFRKRLRKESPFFDRLRGINECENMDFRTIIEKHDDPKAFFYCDPPYWNTEGYYSLHEFNADDHKALAFKLQRIKGRFALSYYYFPELEEWYPRDKFRWEKKEFTKPAGAKEGKDQGIGEELLIMNY